MILLSRIIKTAALVGVVTAIAGLTPAMADVLTFDDLTGTKFFLADYNGFQFGDNNLATNAWFYTDQDANGYTAKSGSEFIATDFQLYDPTLEQATMPISRAAAFVFDGAYFSGQESISYELYSQGSLVFTSAATPIGFTPEFVASGYSGAVDQVVVVGKQGYYGLDDFTYHNISAAVPEPATWAMMIAGVGVAGAALRRQRNVITKIAYAA